MKTFLPQQKNLAQNRKWFLIDATDLRPGKIAARAARILTGKSKAIFAPHLDCGDSIAIVNADKIQFSGAKETQKKYRTHSGYLGNLKEFAAKDFLAKKPEKILQLAIAGMLPKNRLRKNQLLRLRIFAGGDHDLSAQKLEKIEI